MRVKTLLVAATLFTLALAGCLSPGEPLEQAGGEPVMDDAPDDADAQDDDASGEDDDGDESSASTSEEDEGTGQDADSDSGDSDSDADDEADPHEAFEDETVAVLGLIDTGINPYHEVFRDDSALAYVHPSVYIDDYPEDAEPLNLSLDAESYEDALEADEDTWANVTEEKLYWIPGTRIDGAIALGTSSSHCPLLGLPHEDTATGLLDFVSDQVNETTGEADPVECPESVPILDTHGHGTMTASRAAGDGTSLCPDCRITMIEGLGSSSVDWAIQEGWIDVLSNSWVDFVPSPANQAASGTSQSAAEAAENMVTVFASGNGAGYVAGGAPTPTYTLSTAPPGVVLVGAHDNGNVATWSGSPPHVIADGFKSLAAARDSINETGPLAFACCTSSAAPYVSGAAAQLVHEARKALEDSRNGVNNGSLAEGSASLVHSGPLADGNLTLDELRRVLFTTAKLPPQEGPHDGDQHWTADPTSGSVGTNPAQNPYCGLCWTSPIAYDEIPEDVPTYVYTGYGAITPPSLNQALDVLAGSLEEPDREEADTFYELDQTVREQYYPDE